jgi:hypothetical protein
MVRGRLNGTNVAGADISGTAIARFAHMSVACRVSAGRCVLILVYSPPRTSVLCCWVRGPFLAAYIGFLFTLHSVCTKPLALALRQTAVNRDQQDTNSFQCKGIGNHGLDMHGRRLAELAGSAHI